MKPGCFDETSCVEPFLAKFEGAATYNGRNAVDKLAHLRSCLVGGAEDLLLVGGVV